MKLYQVQGKAVGNCFYCGQVKACKLFLKGNKDILVCKSCLEKKNLQISKKKMGLRKAKKKMNKAKSLIKRFNL